MIAGGWVGWPGWHRHLWPDSRALIVSGGRGWEGGWVDPVLIVRVAFGEVCRRGGHTGVVPGQCDLDFHGGIVRGHSPPADHAAIVRTVFSRAAGFLAALGSYGRDRVRVAPGVMGR